MSKCASESNKGFYFGYFWAWYMSSQIVGNALGALIIQHTSGPLFFMIMATIMFGAVICFFWLKMPPKTFVELEQNLEVLLSLN